MLAASTNFATMIDGQEIVCDLRVTLTLPGGVYPDVTLAVDSLHIEAAITTDMPSGTRLEVGYPKIDADITLSGLVDQTDETKTAAWLFGPWGPKAASDGSVSPLYRANVLYSPVTVDIGLVPAGAAGTPELLRKFTGYIDHVTVDPINGTVSLTCLDSHTKLRALPTTPAAIIAPPMNTGTTSEFVLDALVYRASNGAIGTRPATRPSCVLNAGLRTSLFPDVGYQYGQNMQPQYAPGAFGSALQWDAAGVGIFGFTTAAPVGNTFFMEYWTTLAQADPFAPLIGMSDAGSTNTMGVQVTSTTFRVWAPGNGTATPDFVWSFGSIDNHAHYVAVKWTQAPGSTAWSATLYLDNRTQAASGTATAARTANAWNTALVQTKSGGVATVEALQVTNETAPAVNYPFTPTAVLDPSLNTLQAVPAYSGDPWAIIQQIADAELGVAGFDEAGVFRFYNRNTLRSSAVVRTITSTTALMSLASALAASELVNRAQITTQPWTFTAGGLAYQATTAQKITKKSTQTFVIDLGDTLIGQISQTPPTTLPNGHSSTDGFSYFRASTTKNGTAEAVLAPGAVTLQQTDASHVQVTVTNPYSYDVWLVSPANYTDIPVGTPALWISGTSAAQAAGNVADVQFPPVNPDGTGGAVSTQAGEVGYAISDNPWVQDDATAQQLAQDIVADMYFPRPSLTGVSTVADPRLQLIDRVILQDPDVTNIAEHAVIFGWALDWSTSGALEMSTDVRTVAPPGGWIGDVVGRSEGDLTTWGY
jgi:hypothetical protein